MTSTVYLSNQTQPDEIRREAHKLVHSGFLARHRCERYEFVAVEGQWWEDVHRLLEELAGEVTE